MWARLTHFFSLPVISSASACFLVCFLIFKINYFNQRLITLQYCGGSCHTLTWISHGCTCVPHPEAPSHIPPHPIPLGYPSAPALSTLSHASNLGWWSVSYMIIYMFQYYSLRPSHPRLLPQNPKDCSIHLCLLYWCFSFWLSSLCIIGSSFIHLIRID